MKGKIFKRGFTLHLLYNKKRPILKYIKKGAGFTLIEVLVVIFIVGLTSSILVTNWRQNEKRYHLQRAIQEIVQNIRKAQDMALNSYKYDPSQPLLGNYGVYFRKQDTTFYRIFADRDNDNYYDAGEGLGDSIAMEEGAEIEIIETKTNPGSSWYYRPAVSITFSLPDGFTVITRPGSATVYSTRIRIKQTNGTCPQDCRYIIVEKTGRVSIQ